MKFVSSVSLFLSGYLASHFSELSKAISAWVMSQRPWYISYLYIPFNIGSDTNLILVLIIFYASLWMKLIEHHLWPL